MGEVWPEIYPTDNSLPGQAQYLPWTFECATEGCSWLTAHRHEAGARREKERHIANTCPYQGGPNMPGILGKYWEELDKLTKHLIENKTSVTEAGYGDAWDGYNRAKGKAIGIAFCIAELSRPHFVDENNDPSIQKVYQWAHKRYQMDLGEVEIEPTPGVGGHNPYPPPRRDLAPAPKRAPSPKSDPKTGKFVALNDEQRSILKRALGKIPDAGLAKLVKISDEQLAHIKANPDSI